MKATIQFIEKELKDLYPKTEIRAFTRLIIEHVCGLDYTRQILMRDELLEDKAKIKIKMMVARLKKFEPIQYILGETEFLGLKLMVTPGVLIPRPETEELVQWISETELPQSPVVLDVGTGSGCIALAVKKQIPQSVVLAFDISDQALMVAGKNKILNNLEVNFFQADMLNLDQTSWDSYDVIVSNPPYVRESEKGKMTATVLNYEPEIALFVQDNEPLKFYKRISEFANRHLKNGGWLFFEINEHLGNEVIELVEHYGFKSIEIKSDLFGKDRMLRCRK